MLRLVDYQDLIYEQLNINSDDTVITRPLITELLNNQRDLWVRNEYQKNRTIPQELVQDLGCIKLIKTDGSVCCDGFNPNECFILKSEKQIPATIEFHQKDGIISVGPTIMYEKRFTKVDEFSAPVVGEGKIKNKIYWFRYGNHIYLVSKSPYLLGIEEINIRALLSNPLEASDFRTCENLPCYTSNDLYPLPRWMFNYIEETVVNKLKAKRFEPQDKLNDNREIQVNAES